MSTEEDLARKAKLAAAKKKVKKIEEIESLLFSFISLDNK